MQLPVGNRVEPLGTAAHDLFVPADSHCARRFPGRPYSICVACASRGETAAGLAGKTPTADHVSGGEYSSESRGNTKGTAVAGYMNHTIQPVYRQSMQNRNKIKLTNGRPRYARPPWMLSNGGAVTMLRAIFETFRRGESMIFEGNTADMRELYAALEKPEDYLQKEMTTRLGICANISETTSDIA